MSEEKRRWKLRLVLAWYDIWVGAYYDQRNQRLYLMLPFVGVSIERSRAHE